MIRISKVNDMDKEYSDYIDLFDYPSDYDVTLAYGWLNPERIAKKITSLGKYSDGVYKMPEQYTNYEIFGRKLKQPITVPVISFKEDLFTGNDDISDLILSRYQSWIPSCAFKDMHNLKRIWIPKKVTCILKDTFKKCGLTDVYFEGTEEEFNKINIYYKQYTVIPKLGLKNDVVVWYDDGNLSFINAKKHFNITRNDDIDTKEEHIRIGKTDISKILK